MAVGKRTQFQVKDATITETPPISVVIQDMGDYTCFEIDRGDDNVTHDHWEVDADLLIQAFQKGGNLQVTD